MSNEKVVSLAGMTPPDMAVPETVEMLEKMLARAKSGEVRSIAMAALKANGDACTQWHSEGQLFALAGAAGCLTTRMHTE